ncbi:MAG TPA: lytic transglycosylase domain-containing protein [bacterium]|nr:lytic transglycosylase domain-containing protein [bacterium]
MITSQIIVTFFLTVSALQFDFEGGNIEDHINKKILYLQQFTDEERIGFCKAGDVLSCKILFLKEINDRNASSESIEGCLDLLPDEHRYSGIYLYLTGKWKDIPIEKLKIYMGYLPEELSKGLYNIYLKKLYATGNIKAFMDDYIQGRNAELTSYYINSMLKKDPGEALEYLRSLKVSFPESFYDSISKDVEKYATKLKGDSYNEFRIWNLEFNYRKVRYNQAISLASKWFPSKKYSNSYTWRAHLYRAMSHTKKREHDKARAVYGKLEEYLSNELLSDGDIYKFFHEYGYSEAALGDNDKSIELYLKGYEYFISKDEESAAGFLYMAADMSRLAQYWDKAEELYSLYLKNHPGSGRRNMVEFLLFWINYRQKDFITAKVLLNNILDGSPVMSYDHQRASYWLARVTARLGDTVASISLLCSLSAKFPASFYGSMAASRIRENGLTCMENANEQNSSFEQFRFREEKMMPETGWLTAAMVTGERTVIKKMLNAVSKVINEKGDEIDRLTASYIAKTVDDHALAANLIKSISNFSGTSKEYFKLQYTIAFEEEILSHCDFYGVPPMFVFSIARQESLFNTGAVSASYAIGLLQILPTTAQLLANREDYGKINPEVLKKPLTNVRFGVRFLSDLLIKFNGSIPLAAASYNAGPGRIMKWMEKSPDMEIDEFIEDIPIFQTRNYVKKVMSNYAVYTYIFEDRVYDGLEFKLPVE